MKKYISGITAIMLAIALSAFTKANTMNKSSHDSGATFIYTGTSANDYADANAWEVFDQQPECTGGQHVCIARANDASITMPTQFANAIQQAGGTEASVSSVATILNDDKVLP